MSKYAKVYEHIMMRRSDSNVPFADLCVLLTCLGFERRVRGEHHIFTRVGVVDIINIQPQKGMGKPYQIKQIRDLLLKYKLQMED